ncbi:MAG: pilin [Jatrophihabitantaceae bacterium]
MPAVSGGRRRRAGRAALALSVAVVFVLAAGAPAAVAAPPGVAVSGAVRVVALAGSVDAVLTNIRNWIMGILALLATVFLTIGGLRYVIAAGDPGEVAKAKIAFKSAAIGYALAALAPLVVTVLKGIVGA